MDKDEQVKSFKGIIPNFFAGKLNQLRIDAYKELAKEYKCEVGTTGFIFSAGIQFAIDYIVNSQNQQP